MLGSLLTGYASSVISNTLGQPSWFAQMGLAGDDQQTTDIISAANGLFYAGGFFGTLFTYYVSERWGRLMGLKVAAAWAILGGALQAGAMNIPMVSSNGNLPLNFPIWRENGLLTRVIKYLVSRLISGFSAGQTTAAMMPYYSEVSLPNNRGKNSGLHALMIENGATVAAWIGVGCYFYPTGTFAWRFPISLSVLLAILLFVVAFFRKPPPSTMNSCISIAKTG